MIAEQFVEYVYDFYKPDSNLYPMNITRDDIQEATKIRLSDESIPFEGDSVDREMVRDIMIDKMNKKSLVD